MVQQKIVGGTEYKKLLVHVSNANAQYVEVKNEGPDRVEVQCGSAKFYLENLESIMSMGGDIIIYDPGKDKQGNPLEATVTVQLAH